MVLEFPTCTFKCDKENGTHLCQNCRLVNEPDLIVKPERLIDMYLSDSITEAVVFQGLEPLDSFNDVLEFIEKFREKTDDDLVIYTGYVEEEVQDKIESLRKYNNIIIKYGRFKPNQEKHYDDTLGVYLASDNQYAIKL